LYGVIVPAREDLSILDKCLKSIAHQSVRPDYIVLVDDGCPRGAEKVALKYGCIYTRFPLEHESWVGKPQLSLVFNWGLKHLPLEELDYFMVVGSDTILSRNYVETIIQKMGKAVIASGVVRGEENPIIPRGTGRIYNARWWSNNIRWFPLAWSWETYPLYKALATGYKIKVVREAGIYVLRPTRNIKPEYGYTMRELGYFTPLVLARCLKNLVKTPSSAIKLFALYLRYRASPLDHEVASFLRYWQARRLVEKIFFIK